MTSKDIMSSRKTFTIPNAATGSAVAAVQFNRRYKYFLIQCADCNNIDSTTTLGVAMGLDGTDTLHNVYTQDDPGTIWAGGNLPTTAITLAFILTHARGAERLRLILSKVSVGEVVFKITGIHELN